MADESNHSTEAAPTTQPPASSVVVDRNATVRISRWPLYVAAAVIVAFVVFSVVWFARVDDDLANYKPGPVASAFLDAMQTSASGVDVHVTNVELKCLDDAGAGIDPGELDQHLDISDPALSDEMKEFAGKAFDECLTRDTRIALLAQSVSFAGKQITGDEAVCVATRMVDLIEGQGGFASLIEDFGTAANADVLTGMFAAFGACDVSISG